MRINWIFLILGLICSPVFGRIHLRKLAASDVYNALREAGRLDAIPEGRVITQGIAAVTGFAAGVFKGIGIPILLGLAFPNANTNSNNTNTGQTTIQEICFSSRSVDEIDDTENAKNNDDGNDKRKARQYIPLSDLSTGTSSATGTSPSGTQTESDLPSTETEITSPRISKDNAGIDSYTSMDDGEGSGTQSETETLTGTGGSVNCIVIEKPLKS